MGPAGKRCYVIGDVHGQRDLLDLMLLKIEADNARRAPSNVSIVFLGDLIDRGPDSRGVLEKCFGYPPHFADWFFIKGNHEEILLRGLHGEPELLPAWLTHGGADFLFSFAVAPGPLYAASGATIAQVVREAVPGEFLTFMNAFFDYIQFGDYLLVHAGLKPGVPLEQQGRNLRWVRDEFLDSDYDFGAVVVHGHTVEADIVERNNRIGLDTGAYKTGILSAMRLEGPERERLQVGTWRGVGGI